MRAHTLCVTNKCIQTTLTGLVLPLEETAALSASDIKAGSECGGLLQSQLEGKLCIMHLCGQKKHQRSEAAHSSNSINSTSQITSLCDSHNGKRVAGEEGRNTHRKNHTTAWLCNSFLAAPVSEQHRPSRGDWVFFASVSGREIENRSEPAIKEKERRKEGRRQRESKCAALRRSIIYQTPAASLLLLLLLMRQRERVQQKEEETEREGATEGEWESHAYKPAEKRRQ